MFDAENVVSKHQSIAAVVSAILSDFSFDQGVAARRRAGFRLLATSSTMSAEALRSRHSRLSRRP